MVLTDVAAGDGQFEDLCGLAEFEFGKVFINAQEAELEPDPSPSLTTTSCTTRRRL